MLSLSQNNQQTPQQPVSSPALYQPVECNTISTAQPAISSGNHPASSRQLREAKAWSPLQDCPSEMGSMHFIILPDDQWRKGNQRKAMKYKCLVPAGKKIRWPVLSVSQTLLVLSFYLRYHHFSPAPLSYKAIMVFPSLSYKLAFDSCWTSSSSHIGWICSLSLIPLCCLAAQYNNLWVH